MPHWTLDDIPWDRFDASRLDLDILKLVKAAALTEFNAARYTAYLDNVFKDDAAFRGLVHGWQAEEEQHGKALGRYAALADPSFDFAAAFRKCSEGYVIPIDVERSVRGSKVGEMVARCVVETGTSSYYSALADATDEPVLKEIFARIAGDEFRHYKLFLDCLRKYLPAEPVSRLSRIRVAVGRMRESEDDELAYAWHCANEPGMDYDRSRAVADYGAIAFRVYRFHHVERGMAMVMKAAGLKPQGWLGRAATYLVWFILRGRAQRAPAPA